jgi:hypothetical protein
MDCSGLSEAAMKSKIIHISLILSLLLGLKYITSAQTTPAGKGTATISGRVTIDGQPAPGVEVILRNYTMTGGRSLPLTATTDAEGRYTLTNVPAGNCHISAYAPAFVSPDQIDPYTFGKAMNIAEGENVEKIDFKLTHGGVITGKVSGSDGKTVIAMMVFVIRVDENGKLLNEDMHSYSQWLTDDRGVYRIYGLKPGRYKVKAGSPSEVGRPSIFFNSGGAYSSTFHPDAIEEQQAKIVEVKAGSEIEGVDITLARASKGFSASGRLIDSETGKPVASMIIGYSLNKNGRPSESMAGLATNSRGEFKIDRLPPNNYSVFAAPNIQNIESEMYSDSASFDITNGDVSGLVIKMYRGASISGVAVVEGTKDPAALASLPHVEIMTHSLSLSRGPENMMQRGQGTINADGTFKIKGVRPGKVYLNVMPFDQIGLSLLRIEYNGVEVKDIDVSAGDQITGVRLVFAYGNSAVAGRVEVKGGTLPEGTKMFVNISQNVDGIRGNRLGGSEVDSRGMFLIEGLPQGTHKLVLNVWNQSSNSALNIPSIEQIITVGANSKQEVTLVLDLSKKEGDK